MAVSKGVQEYNAKSDNYSIFNEAMYKMARLDDQQKGMNFYWATFDEKSDGDWNYKHYYRLCQNLRSEGKPKYTDIEINEVERIEKIIDFILEYQPPHKEKLVYSRGEKKKVILVNKKSLVSLRFFLDKYQSTIRKFNDLHGLGTHEVAQKKEALW